MRKFSKLTNQKINEEPKLDRKIDESEVFKYEMIDLMNRFLKVQSYGSVDNRFLSGSVKIEGKEILAEALLGLFKDVSNKDQKRVLESLKSDIKDWELIDNKIKNISKPSINIINKLKFSKMLERYEDDSLVVYLENKISNINNINILKDYLSMMKNSKISYDVREKCISILEYQLENFSK
jgi:hypothetical protein